MLFGWCGLGVGPTFLLIEPRDMSCGIYKDLGQEKEDANDPRAAACAWNS